MIGEDQAEPVQNRQNVFVRYLTLLCLYSILVPGTPSRPQLLRQVYSPKNNVVVRQQYSFI